MPAEEGLTDHSMAPKLSEDEIDDLIYFSRAGETADLTEQLSALASREGVSPAEILLAAKDEGKSTCLHMATGNGHLGLIKSLLEHFKSRPKEEKQAFLDAPNEYGNTGLHWASLGGHLEIVKLLVENGASPALANDKDQVPLDLAAFGDKVDIVDYFLSQSGNIESQNTEGVQAATEGIEIEGGEDAGDDGPSETQAGRSQ